MQEVRDLLIYKIETYDEHIAKFKAGNMTPDKVEKLWNEKVTSFTCYGLNSKV